MSGFYDDMRAMVADLFQPDADGGLGQGEIELVLLVPGAPGANAWDPPADPTRQVTPLNGVARGVGKELVGLPVENGGQIVASDLLVIVEPWGADYDPAFVLEIDGKAVTVLSVQNVPEAGTVCAVKFVARR